MNKPGDHGNVTGLAQSMLVSPIFRRRSLALAGFAGALLTVSAHAAENSRNDDPADLADLSIQELMDLRVDKVSSASKYEQKVTQAPASVSIVTAEDIRKFGHRTLADVLRSMRGLFVSDDRNYSFLGSRGFLRPGDYNSRMLLLIDGHRMNDNVYDGAYVGGEAMVDMALIERVEFIRGPSSSIYGSSAFFGVINVITKKTAAAEGTAISGSAGSFGTYEETISHGMRLGADADLLVSATNQRSAGERHIYYPEFDQRISDDPRARDDGVASNTDGNDSFGLFGRVRYREVSLSAFLTSRTKQVPTASFGTMFNGGEQTTDGRSFLDLKFEHAISTTWQVNGRAYYDYWDYTGDYPGDSAAPGTPPDRVVFTDEAQGTWAGTEWQFTGRLFDLHTLVAGVEYRENLKAHQRNYDETSLPDFYLDDNRRSRTEAVYVQGDFALAAKLHLNAGLRYDDYPQGFGSTINPRLGLIGNPLDNTTVKALYGQAFRAPNLYERFYYPAQAARPELEPEKIRTYELVVEQYFDRRHRLSVSAYHYAISQLITQRADENDDIFLDNLANTKADGVEIEFEGKYDSGVHGWASYALQRATDSGSGEELASSPRHMAKFNLHAPVVRNRLSAAVELQYHGSVSTLSGGRAGGFLLSNLNLVSEPFAGGLEMSAGVQNLFNRQYGYPGAEEQAQDVIGQYGRNFRLKATYRFGKWRS